ncbi:MAG: hypothetical protein ACYTDY_13525 [Planctomycetota bacterium]|jgi:hypothetical protein
MKTYLLGLSPILLLLGCVRLGPVPSVQQFAADPEGTWEAYPELEELASHNASGVLSAFAGVLYSIAPDDWVVVPSSLVEQWGEPDRTRLSWWNLLPWSILPLPFHVRKTWFWDAGDKEVYAVVVYSFVKGYTGMIWIVDVEDKPEEEKEEEAEERERRRRRRG